jgi:rod shape-determining protein MreB and related proteins
MNFVSKLKPTIYIQISPEQITLKNLKTGVSITEIPELAIAETNKSHRSGDTADKSHRSGDTADKSRRSGDTADKSHRSGDTADKSRRSGDTADKLGLDVLPRRDKVLAIGQQAKPTAAAARAVLINPFAHPRSLVSDFYTAEVLIKHLLKNLLASSLFAISPRIVMHPLGSPEGGFTQVELRAFKEMALAAGASEVVVWTGIVLSDQELRSLWCRY